MKKLLLSGVAFGVLVAVPAAAADLAARPVYRAPPVMAAPYVISWSGCYLGGNVGYHRSSYDQKLSFDDNPSPEHVFTDNLLAAGAIGGYQVGCQVQTGHYVWGIEHDYGWTGGTDSRAYSPDPAEAETVGFSAKTKSVLTVRGRFGYAEGDHIDLRNRGMGGRQVQLRIQLDRQ